MIRFLRNSARGHGCMARIVAARETASAGLFRLVPHQVEVFVRGANRWRIGLLLDRTAIDFMATGREGMI
jgi:hypothetical protein